MREQIGWGRVDVSMAQISLNNSLFHVTIRDGDTLVGMGRVIGDGAMFFYIQDVVVAPSYQGQGIGHAIMLEIENYLSTAVASGATVGLLAAAGKERFYQKYGYLERTGQPLGLGMCRFVE